MVRNVVVGTSKVVNLTSNGRTLASLSRGLCLYCDYKHLSPGIARRKSTAADWTNVEFLLMTVGLVALVWVAIVFLRGGLIGGALLVLLVGSCFGSPFYSVPTGVIPLTADRLIWFVLAAQYVVYRQWGWADPKPLAKTDWLFAALIVVFVASTFTHDFKISGWLPVSQLLFYYLMPAAMYWIARQAAWTQRQALWLFTALGVFGIYLCLTAVAETHQAWAFVFPKYIASPEYHEFFGRGRGPLLNPAGLGFFMGVCLIAALMWWPRLNRRRQLMLLVLVLPIFALGAYSTLTRSVWMGLALGLAIVIALSVPRGWRVAVLGSLAIVSVVGVAVSWEYLYAFKRDKDLSVEDMAESARLRPILATVAWHMFEDRPLLGFGFGQYAAESPAYLSDRTSDLPLEKARPYIQHNVFLCILTETGVLGLGLFVLLLGCWIFDAWQVWRCVDAPLWARQCALLLLGTMGVYVSNAMFHNVSIIPMFNMLFFFLAGVSEAMLPLARAPKAIRPALRLWTPAAARA